MTTQGNTMHRLTRAAALLATTTVLAAACGTAVAPASQAAVSCAPVASHRGAGAGYPSGSRGAFYAAVQSGARVLEMDVRFTKSGTPTVYHDKSIAGNTNGRGSVESFVTWTALSKYSIDGMPAGGQTAIPTLFQVLDDNKSGPVTTYLVELKTYPTAKQFAAFLDRIDTTVGRSKVIVEAFDVRTLDYVKLHAPSLRRGYITSSAVSPAEVVKHANVSIPVFTATTSSYVNALHAAGVRQVYPWTVNSSTGWRDMSAAGVTATLTDKTDGYIADQCN